MVGKAPSPRWPAEWNSSPNPGPFFSTCQVSASHPAARRHVIRHGPALRSSSQPGPAKAPASCHLHISPGPASGLCLTVDHMAMITGSPQLLSVSEPPVSPQQVSASLSTTRLHHKNQKRADTVATLSRESSAGLGQEGSIF